jgi:hypothetical protein
MQIAVAEIMHKTIQFIAPSIPLKYFSLKSSNRLAFGKYPKTRQKHNK